jgi:hypothetical protein
LESQSFVEENCFAVGKIQSSGSENRLAEKLLVVD